MSVIGTSTCVGVLVLPGLLNQSVHGVFNLDHDGVLSFSELGFLLFVVTFIVLLLARLMLARMSRRAGN